jgi:hypothetical protein
MSGRNKAPPFPPFWPPQIAMAAAKPREGITRVPKPTDISADNHPEQRKRAAATEVIDFRDSCRHRDILDGDTVFRYHAPDQPATGGGGGAGATLSADL